GRETVCERRPVRAAVGGLEEAAAGTVRRRVDEPRRTADGPERRVHRLRIRRIERQIDRADAVALVEHLLPRRAAVLRSIHAAIGMRTVDVAERRDEHDVRIPRVHDYAADLPRRLEADVLPGPARVGGSIYAVAELDRVAHVGLAGADVHDVGI